MKSTGLYNIFVLICFTVLAVLFNKWWVIFFALLFLGSSHIETIYAKCRVCDNCGAKSQSAITADEAISRAKQAGWVHINEGNLDYCPKCKSKLNLDIEE